MTEKRFELAYNNDWWAVRADGITLWKEEVVHLMNEQEDLLLECEDNYFNLIKYCERLFEKYQSLKKENKKLNQILGSIITQVEKNGYNHTCTITTTSTDYDLFRDILTKYHR